MKEPDCIRDGRMVIDTVDDVLSFDRGVAEMLNGIADGIEELQKTIKEIGGVELEVEDVEVCDDGVHNPSHYYRNGVWTCDKVDAVIEGLPAREAACMAQLLQYFDRAGSKEGNDLAKDLDKANNYAHKLVYGEFRRNNG